MKKLIIFLFTVLITSSACADEKNTGNNNQMENTSVIITVNGKEFNAVFYNNETANAFINMLPLTLNMNELNGNEKYYNLSTTLPVNSERVGSIKKGDIMLYGSNCIVVFYESFNTPYSYTKIGYIENTDNLSSALGSGSVSVSFKK